MKNQRVEVSEVGFRDWITKRAYNSEVDMEWEKNL